MPSFTTVSQASVDNGPIPLNVLQLPPNMEPQPAMVACWCEACIISLTTPGKKGDPDGTFESFIRVLVVAGTHCSMPDLSKTNSTVCRPCSTVSRGGCMDLQPQFRRAANIFEYLLYTARRHTRQYFKGGVFPSLFDNTVINGILSQPKIKKDWMMAYDYAKRFRNVINGMYKDQNRLIKEEYGGDTGAFRQARERSAESNLRRYEMGIGTLGLCRPTNVVVDAHCEELFRGEQLQPRERRYFYYGTHIPRAQSDEDRPCKRTRTRTPGSPSYQLLDMEQ
ncbi:hypothetical protein P154DRAFT_572697 [Amniculicola lignicola CBS 123094]|uniref:Uncharacterized protein n=1 Tax=Amniculicola lignicola CBS 123094 TaxID=1392246 RepID=A0A6A5WPR0_9PLEO|nr:hypothetical protein P154DRAFT_572697 [Amniculicola lignicola CBS 123094]